MKKTFSLLLALAMVLSLAACGGKDTPADDVDTPDTPAENNQPDTQQPGEPDNEPAQPEDRSHWKSTPADCPGSYR